MIARDVKRTQIAAKYAAKRTRLKAVMRGDVPGVVKASW